MINEYLLILITIGFAIGTISGMIGIGGGVILIPFLLLFFDLISPGIPDIYLYVATTSLLCAFSSVFFGFLGHFRNKNYYQPYLFYLAIGIVFGEILGNYLSFIAPQKIFRFIILVFLIIYTVKLFIEIVSKKKVELPPEPLTKKNKVILWISGFVIGTIAPLAGLSGGVLLIPILTTYFHLDYKRTAGTSSFALMFTTIPAVIVKMIAGGGEEAHQLLGTRIGYLSIDLTLPILISMSIAAYLGSYLNKKLPVIVIKIIAFSIFIVSIIKIGIDFI